MIETQVLRCRRGHEFDEKNTYLYQGRRYCRACRADNQRPRNEAHKDAIRPQGPRMELSDGLKFCKPCSTVKPISDFPIDRVRADGHYSYCKPCCSERSKRILAVRKSTPEGKASLRRVQRRRALKEIYGLTVEDYDRMVAEQNGLCAICGEPETSAAPNTNGAVRVLSIDHDHVTGSVRGLLCHRCNVVLGLSNEDPDRLEMAARYLRSWLPSHL